MLSERFGKVLQKWQSMTINRQDKSTSISTQLDSLSMLDTGGRSLAKNLHIACQPACYAIRDRRIRYTYV
jgi:hypothetical protein